MFREFYLGFIKIHILYHASKESIYGSAIIEELNSHGYDLSPGTVYPYLHRLEEKGYLKSEEEVVEGKVRRYYTITDKGKELLEDIKPRIKELVEEVLYEKREKMKTDEHGK